MIKPKEKPCKGTTSETRGFGCGNITFHRVYGLCKSKCYPDWLLNTEAGKIKLKKATLKAIGPRLELEKARQEKKDNNSLGWLLTNTKNACHDYIKARDKGKDCVSCGQPWNKDHHAGHFKKAELFSTLRFHENNIHNQCPGCNIFKDGNEQEYGLRIHLRIGRIGLKELNALAELDHALNHKWDREALKTIRKYYQDKIKQINK